ncbi:energy transducer TonB [uncultured Flavobacterium sp.]|uniref:energy transducer TonB n=1 Tax=uncultured Flavobacterium sp. TaxID=165435 RepID=UPI0030CA5214|tara:strand:- start:1351 stop:2079 length:729 start_codon:yes stop_codon:yes gene_type:complete
MQPKKNPNVDAKRNSLLYFQIGLAAITILTYIAIETKTIDPVIVQDTSNRIDNFIDEEAVPLTQQLQKLPPPPPPAPEVIQVVKDEVVLEEKKIAVTETSEKVAIKAIAVGDKKGDLEDIDVDVPFAVLEDIPLFPGCEKVSRDKQKDCFLEQMNKHIKKYFSYPERAQEDGSQGRVTVMFVIDKTGTVTNLRIRGTGKDGSDLLESEAERIIKKLPKFTPGKQRGKAVGVSYAQPIMFRLE